ncbi:MAG: DUF3320 domain-containing protein [Devosia sp.]|nr:DUF3320 domain-containing protein [Devosia sp.]
MGSEVRVSGAIAGHLSVAFHQNEIPPIREITIENDLDRDLADIEVRIEAEPAFATPTIIRVDRLAAGSSIHISPVDLKLDSRYLRQLTEGMRGTLSIAVGQGSDVLARNAVDIALLPPSQWGGTGAAPELLAAFVRPNDPAIDVILHDAAAKLAAAGKAPAIDGYRAGKRERTWELASAIWSAIAGRGIVYVLPPASFERSGQKVRGPSDILERKAATCLDLTLLFAACLEQAGLHPVLVLTQGHAFVGLWLKEDQFSTSAVDDMQVLRKRRDLEDLIFIETTFLTSSPPGRFRDAVSRGGSLVEEGGIPLEVAIDLKQARSRHIKPLELGEAAVNAPSTMVQMAAIELGVEDAPQFVSEVVVREQPDSAVDRLERWKRKLLDLSLRNKLLNFKDTRKAVPLECPEPGRLEDMLSVGTKFKLMPKSEVLSESDGRDLALFGERHQDDGRRSYLLEALERLELYTTLPAADLDNRLTDLFRATRTSFEEGGSNILFLAVGFLKWTQKNNAPALRAPLLLVPVSLQRGSVRAGFRLVLHDEEVRFNPTLLQMLRQDFALTMPELEKDLPTDQSGIDVERILRIVRTHVQDLRGWEVTPEVVLSTFSFTKFLMWRDLVERMDDLKRSPVVRHLIDTPKQQYGAGGAPFPAAENIDRDHHPIDIFAPLSADSSQLSAVLAASAGKDFVLFGPPGTGKSQTIANIISQCLAMGKTVLFVSQKTAALEVVQRRLGEIGLGEYCLEVHSTKAQKSAVLGQLKQAWHDRSMPSADKWDEETALLATLRDELNALVVALHRRRSNGLNAHAELGRVVRERDRFPGLRFDWPVVEHSEADLLAMREACRSLKPIVDAIGDPASHPLRGVDIIAWDPFWKPKVGPAIDASIAALAPLRDAAAAFGKSTGLPVPASHEEILGLEAFGRVLVEPAGLMSSALLGPDGLAIGKAAVRLSELQKQVEEVHAGLIGRYRSAVLSEDLERLREDWTAATQSNFVVRPGRQRRVQQELQAFATAPLPDDLAGDLVRLAELRDISAEVDQLAPVLSMIPELWDGLDTDSVRLRSLLDWSVSMRRETTALATTMRVPAEALLGHVARLHTEYAQLFAESGPIPAAQAGLATALAAVRRAGAVLNPLIGRVGDAPIASGDRWVEDATAMLALWRSGLDLAPAWAQWNRARRDAGLVGLTMLVDAIESGAVKPGEINEAFRTAYARWWTDIVVAADPLLRNFLSNRHDDAIARFRAADERVAELCKRIVRARLAGDVPAPTAFGTDPEWGALARELQQRTKSKQQPLRQLFSNIPTVLTKLTPCVMMSPLSIAQYLPPDAKPFDVVIFDEASQIPVWDAIGAIARATQAVIVGDPEQLPPTSVGERGVEDVENDEDIEDQESILDEALASNIPARRLDWHYRSRHESLIAFSNHHYYKGNLVTFPSPVTDDRAVRYVHVPGGVYERGSGRVNRTEARAVVAEVVRRLRDPAFVRNERSLGVVTFNGEQMRLIDKLLEKERYDDPALEKFWDKAQWKEPVLVKNLENVQGDERDIIIFSVAVGPDQAGRVVSTVSSLNKDGGHRRLNVAITRARHEMVVFATLRPEQIDLSRSAARGVRDFKHFLEYAERGARAMAEAAHTLGETESPFEDAVKAALEARGWTVHAQIGVSGFRIDLGVVDPDAPGRYLAGVECDGASYHRSATARDRDRLREFVLRDLGWRIHRVWSTDWWMNMESAIGRLDASLRSDLEITKAERAEAEEEQMHVDPPPPAFAAPVEQERAEPTGQSDAPTEAVVLPSTGELVSSDESTELNDVSRERRPQVYADIGASLLPNRSAASIASYRAADLAAAGFAADPQRFYDPDYRPRIREMVEYVLSVEAPIYEDMLISRIARAHGFARAGGNIRATVSSAIERMIKATNDDGRRLIWRADADTSVNPPFRRASSDVRSHTDVPLCELAALAALFAQEGGDREEVARRMALEFDLGRFRTATRERFERAYDLAVGRPFT